MFIDELLAASALNMIEMAFLLRLFISDVYCEAAQTVNALWLFLSVNPYL